MKPEEANLTSLPFETVKRVFQNAEALLSKENVIVSAPGSNEMAFMAESKTSKRPHYVFVEKSGKITCENCPVSASANLCKHAVAVGEKTQQLGKYMEWIRRRNAALNLTTLVTYDSTKGVGKKKKNTSTSRRKCGRNTVNKEPSVIVDRVRNTLQNSHVNLAQQQQQQK